MDSQVDVGNSSRPVIQGIVISVILTLLFQVGIALFSLVGAGTATNLEAHLSLSAVGAAQLVMMFLPAVLLAPPFGFRNSPLLRFRSVPMPVMLVSIVGTVAMWGLTQSWLLVQEVFLIPSWLQEIYHTMTWETEKTYRQLFTATSVVGMIPVLVVGGLIPAVSEETLFRGLAQSLFERTLRPAGAIALAAFLFALLHLQPFMFLPLMGLGYYFGYLAWRTGSVLPSVIGHFIFNAISLVVLHSPDSDGVMMPTHRTADDLVVVAPVLVLSSLAIVLVAWWMERR